jgi:uncharacterized protein with von Willebrand factor type A (vWA) domain
VTGGQADANRRHGDDGVRRPATSADPSSNRALAANLLLFGRMLRRAGLDVHHGRLLDAVRALEWIGLERRDDVRATLKALLVHAHDDLARFDVLFDAFFRAHRPAAARDAEAEHDASAHVQISPIASAPPQPGAEAGDENEADEALSVGAYSATGVSRKKDFADFTERETAAARRLLAAMPWQLGARITRRWQRRSGAAPDLRRLVRRSVMHGEVLELPRRRRRIAPRPIIVIGDVSGSMERYSRMLLHFAHGLSQSAGHVESFVFATRLTRITRFVTRRSPAHDLAQVIDEVTDWGGGTRIGDALRTFNTVWARRVMRHGPVVLIVSDGWDRGDPGALAAELARVRRSCRRLIWLNPLLGSAGYEPLTRGLQAALGFVDDFLPVHNLESLERLAIHLQRLPTSRRPRRRASQ